MTAGLKPFLTRGTAERTAAWDRLAAGSARFRRLEGLYSTIWGVALLADCVARLVGRVHAAGAHHGLARHRADRRRHRRWRSRPAGPPRRPCRS